MNGLETEPYKHKEKWQNTHFKNVLPRGEVIGLWFAWASWNEVHQHHCPCGKKLLCVLHSPSEVNTNRNTAFSEPAWNQNASVSIAKGHLMLSKLTKTWTVALVTDKLLLYIKNRLAGHADYSLLKAKLSQVATYCLKCTQKHTRTTLTDTEILLNWRNC